MFFVLSQVLQCSFALEFCEFLAESWTFGFCTRTLLPDSSLCLMETTQKVQPFTVFTHDSSRDFCYNEGEYKWEVRK